MANHCYNYIVLNGNTEVLEELSEAMAEAEAFDDNYFTEFCDRVLKINKRIDPAKDYGFYGTKWFEYSITDKDVEMLIIQGDSAWGPPDRFVEEICKQYGLCATLEYEEPGMDFAGIVKYDSTGQVDHEEFTFYELQYRNDIGYWQEEILNMHYDDEDDEEIKEYLKNATYASDEHKKEVLDSFNNSKKE
jgi:hypothetical protein